MFKDFILPNYDKCNLNITSTIAEFLGCKNTKTTLPILKNELNKNYKNIIYVCCDGLGIYPIEKNLNENNFLRRNIKQTLVSTFPSTTTNATNSLLMNKYPLEHGWMGWSMYFEDMDRCIDIFKNTDSYTEETVEISNSPLDNRYYFFDETNTDYEINSVFPPYVNLNDNSYNNIFENVDQFFEHLENICNKKGKQFCYAYLPEPDHSMHDYGVSSEQAKQLINQISDKFEKLHNNTKDTLFVITADHGQIDVEGYIELYKDEQLMNLLEVKPYMEARAPAFKVKADKHEEFEKMFKQKYSQDFVLYKSKDLIEKGFFGKEGNKQHLLGDFVAIGTYTHKQMIFKPNSNYFKGHHTSLTEEMLVPLILISN